MLVHDPDSGDVVVGTTHDHGPRGRACRSGVNYGRTPGQRSVLQRCLTTSVWLGRRCLQSLNRMPSLASLSRLGVSISLPKQPMSEKPRSSATMRRMCGRLPVMVLL